MIHAVGNPMSGFHLEFKRQYSPEETNKHYESFQIGQIHSQHVQDWDGQAMDDYVPRGNIEQVARQIPLPEQSNNFLAPINDVS